jgi:hypothetical protein
MCIYKWVLFALCCCFSRLRLRALHDEMCRLQTRYLGLSLSCFGLWIWGDRVEQYSTHGTVFLNKRVSDHENQITRCIVLHSDHSLFPGGKQKLHDTWITFTTHGRTPAFDLTTYLTATKFQQNPRLVIVNQNG